MEQFNFRYNGFKTVYTAKPARDTYLVYAGMEPVMYFEQSEMQKLMKEGKILKIYDQEDVE